MVREDVRAREKEKRENREGAWKPKDQEQRETKKAKRKGEPREHVANASEVTEESEAGGGK